MDKDKNTYFQELYDKYVGKYCIYQLFDRYNYPLKNQIIYIHKIDKIKNLSYLGDMIELTFNILNKTTKKFFIHYSKICITTESFENKIKLLSNSEIEKNIDENIEIEFTTP